MKVLEIRRAITLLGDIKCYSMVNGFILPLDIELPLDELKQILEDVVERKNKTIKNKIEL